MRRFAIAVGLAAALAAATAAPAVAQTITPASYDWGNVNPKQATSQPLAEFQLTAGAAPLNGTPAVISGDTALFSMRLGAGACDGSLSATQSCIFRVAVRGSSSAVGAKSAVVGVLGGPTATVRATFTTDGGSGGPPTKRKSCKKKGKKSAATSGKKKGCKKKGKK